MNNGKAIAGWCIAPLSEAAEVIMGSSPPGESYNDKAQGVPLINGPVEFSAGDLGRTIRGQYTTEPTKMCRDGDLLLCVRGSTTGRTNIAGFDACIGRGVAVIRAKQDQQFLNHYIRTQRQRLFDLGNGSTFPSITQDQLAEVKVLLPPLPEQRRIATILDKADRLRRIRSYALELGDGFDRAAYRQFFGDPHRSVNNWPMKPLGAECERVTVGFVGTMVNEYVPEGIPLLRSLNVRRNVIDPTDLKFISNEFHAKISKSKLLPGDVVSVRTGNPGVTAVMPTSFPIANCADLIVMTCGASLVPQFLSETLNILLGDAEEIQGTTGAIQTHFNIARARELVIPVPPLAIQKEFTVLVQRAEFLRKVHREALRQAEHLFQTLLHRAFTTGL